jgi:hypothetical protein
MWVSKNEMFEKLLETKDFCGYPEERILQRYFSNEIYSEDGILVNS